MHGFILDATLVKVHHNAIISLVVATQNTLGGLGLVISGCGKDCRGYFTRTQLMRRCASYFDFEATGRNRSFL